MEVSGQLHASAALLPRKGLWYPLDKRMSNLEYTYFTYALIYNLSGIIMDYRSNRDVMATNYKPSSQGVDGFFSRD
jgi:hypothetical protein